MQGAQVQRCTGVKEDRGKGVKEWRSRDSKVQGRKEKGRSCQVSIKK